MYRFHFEVRKHRGWPAPSLYLVKKIEFELSNAHILFWDEIKTWAATVHVWCSFCSVFSFIFNPFICYISTISILFLYVYICKTYMSDACRGQKRVPDALGLELQVVVSWHLGTELNPDLLQEQVFLMAEPSQ